MSAGDPERGQAGGSKVVRVHVFVDGWVQGVSFRYHMVQEAMRLGVTGWVRNLPDGRVEAVYQAAGKGRFAARARLARARQGRKERE